LQEELANNGAAMAQSHAADRAGELAARLCEQGGGRLNKVFFCSSGSEGVETIIKFSRAFTGRKGLLYAEGAFHGLSCGALSLMGDSFWRGDFGPLLPDTQSVTFGDIATLEHHLATRKFAALILEPIQSEGGIRIPDAAYLQTAQALCREYGTLFVLDEVQTALGRTGRFLAGHRYGVEPDMVVLAKALSGGLIPSAAVLMADAIYQSIYDSLKHSIIHTSTYSENGLAMRAGLATLDVIQEEGLVERSERLGIYLRQCLSERLSDYEMVKDIRGAGLLSGIEFTAPKQISLRLPFEAFRRIHPGMFGQTIVMRLFRDKNILTQMCGNNFMVLKVAPPLIVSESEIDRFVTSIGEVVELVHSSSTFWTDALGLAKRALNL
jgi:ornithine--oxo-acid transaminase